MTFILLFAPWSFGQSVKETDISPLRILPPEELFVPVRRYLPVLTLQEFQVGLWPGFFREWVAVDAHS
jgi:hypothetical protein